MAKPKSKWYSWDDEGKISFKSEWPNLRCLTCNEVWCDHLKFAMVNHLDQAWVWDGDDWSEKIISIPMFPTQGQWAIAKLQIIEDAPVRMARLYLSDPIDPDIPISYLHPGEGRNVIRTSFIDYMLGARLLDMSDTASSICKSPSHKFKQEKAWQERTRPDSKHRVVEYWSVWVTGNCTACRAVNSGFDPDLVPDKEGSIW